MSVMEIKRERTISLATDFIDCINAVEKFGYAKVWRNPIWWLRKKFTKDRIEDRLLKPLQELMDRYEGVMCQVLKRGGAEDDALEDLISEIWLRAQDDCRTVQDYRSFSSVLWEAYSSVSNAPALPLKPKFMLRQFVDEMLSSDERGILISLAYSSHARHHPVDRDILPRLTQAYALLHQQVLNHEADLEMLTDGAMNSAMVRELRPPYVQYKVWLFDS
jgi:hypothetical protein